MKKMMNIMKRNRVTPEIEADSTESELSVIQKLQKWKHSIELKIYNHFSEASESIKHWEKIAVSNHIILSESIDDYLSYKPISKKRVCISWAIDICFYIG